MDEHTLRKRLKRIGSKHWTAKDAQAVLAAQTASGTSMSAFARRLGVRARRLQWWKTRLSDWNGMQPRAEAVFAPAVVREPSPLMVGGSHQVAVRLPSGEVVEIVDASLVPPEWVSTLVAGFSREG